MRIIEGFSVIASVIVEKTDIVDDILGINHITIKDIKEDKLTFIINSTHGSAFFDVSNDNLLWLMGKV